MKVIYLTKYFRKGGSGTGNRRLANDIRSAGHEVILLDSTMISWFTKAIRLFERALDRIFFSSDVHYFKLLFASFSIDRLIQKHSPDVIILGDISGNLIEYKNYSSYAVPIIHRLSDFYPYLGFSHYGVNKLFSTIISSTPKNFTPKGFIFPSNWLRSEIKKYCKVDNEIFLPNSPPKSTLTKARKRVSDTIINLGFISTNINDPRKNLEVVVNALNKFDFKGKLHIFGRGSVNINSNMELHGFKKSFREIFQYFDILLVPSTFDNSPNVILESYSFGIPVISNTGSGFSDYVLDSKTGFKLNFNGKPDDLLLERIKVISKDYEKFSNNAINFNKHLNHNVPSRLIKFIDSLK